MSKLKWAEKMGYPGQVTLKDTDTGETVLLLATSTSLFRKAGDYSVTLYVGNMTFSSSGGWDDIRAVLTRLYPRELMLIGPPPLEAAKPVTREEYLRNR